MKIRFTIQPLLLFVEHFISGAVSEDEYTNDFLHLCSP